MHEETSFDALIIALCDELGVEPRLVKEIHIDETRLTLTTYVLHHGGVDAVDHRRAALTETHQYAVRHAIGTAKGEARRREPLQKRPS